MEITTFLQIFNSSVSIYKLKNLSLSVARI